jgi:transcriptional regulator with XRE-family HTH domain
MQTVTSGTHMLVQKLRLQRGWSQQQLSDLSGLSVRTIQRIENGQTASVESLKSLASVFEIDFSQLSSEPAMSDSTATSTVNALAQTTPNITPQHTAALEEQLALAHVRKVKKFYLHVAKYVFVMALLLVINLTTRPHYLWVIWPALGWGLGLVTHGAAVFGWLPFFGAGWEKRQVEKRLGRPL